MARERKSFGGRPKGWRGVNLDMPEQFVPLMQTARESLPVGSMKIMGTAAMAMWLGMPPEVREAMYRWVHAQELDPEKIDVREAIGVVIPILLQLGIVVPPGAGPGGGASELGPGEFDVVYPAAQRDGYTEQVVRRYGRVASGQSQPAKQPRAAGGG